MTKHQISSSFKHRTEREWPSEWWDRARDRRWLEKRNRRVMIGGHFADEDQLGADFPQELQPLSCFDPKQIARQLKEIGTEVFYFYSKCHFGNAYYPTRHGHIHSKLGGRDLFGELVEACHEVDILPGCVYEFSDNRIRKDHPEWCHMAAKAKSTKKVEITEEASAMQIAGPCLSGPYGEMVIEQAREVVANYPIGCYWIDFLGLFGSFDAWECPYCNERYREEFGQDFPGTASMEHAEYLRYYDWRRRITDEYAARLVGAIRAIRPDIAVCLNYFALNPAKTAQLQFQTVRDHFDFAGKDTFAYRVGSLRGSWLPRAVRAASSHAPGEMLLDGVIACKGDLFSAKPLDDYRAEVWSTRFAGSQHCASVVPTIDGALDPAHLALIGHTFSEQNRFESLLSGSAVAARIGILLGASSLHLDLLESTPWSNTEDSPYHYTEFSGWVQTLIEHHELWDLLQDGELVPERLASLDILLLPHVACLSSVQVEAVRDFVRRGGVLIASGLTSLKDENGSTSGQLALSDVFGVNYSGRLDPSLSRLVEIDPPLASRPAHFSQWIPSDRGHAVMEVHPDARVLAHACKVFPVGLTFAHLPQQVPSLVEHSFGRGRSFYFPWLCGHQYWETGHHTLARFLHSVLNHAQPRPRPLELEGAGTVEMSLLALDSDREKWLVGLLNRPGSLSRRETVNVGSSAFPAKCDPLDHIPVLAGATLTVRPENSILKPEVEVLQGGLLDSFYQDGESWRLRLRDLSACCLIQLGNCKLSFTGARPSDEPPAGI